MTPPPARVVTPAHRTRLAKAWHLVRRFFGSLRPGGPSPADDAWARRQLLAGEVGLWRAMSDADRRHAAGVARSVADELDRHPPAGLGRHGRRAVLAAALLHDVGKTASSLGTFGRVAATLEAAAVRRDPEVVDGWARRRGHLGQVGRYLQHPRRGGDLLVAAGSDQLTSDWARQHHQPEERWSVPAEVGAILKACDDD